MKLLQILNEIEVVRNERPYVITVGNKKLLVSLENPGKMNWEQANAYIASLGPHWRLPTKQELEEVYKQLYLQEKGGFSREYVHLYWSDREVTGRKRRTWCVAFTNWRKVSKIGYFTVSHDDEAEVCPVRSTT